MKKRSGAPEALLEPLGAGGAAESDGGGGGGLELPGWVEGHADALVALLAATTLYHAVRPTRHGEACGDGCKDD